MRIATKALIFIKSFFVFVVGREIEGVLWQWLMIRVRYDTFKYFFM
jgi:hypothetical protein